MELSEIRKTLVTAAGIIVSVGTLVLGSYTDALPKNVATAIAAAVGIATVVLNYLAPNETSDPLRALGRSVRLVDTKPGELLTPEVSAQLTASG